MKEKKMMSARLHGVGDLRVEQVDMPVCREDEVLVKVKCCGICGSDIGRVFETGTYSFPLAPGHEFSGVVVEDAEQRLTGKRVAVFPLLPCFDCDMCRQKRYAQCAHYDYYGSRRDGGFGEYVAVKRFNLVMLPEAVSFELGAMCEPLAVGLHGVKKLGMLEGQTVLISGAGTIGLLAAFWARAKGAKKVMLFDLDEEKMALAAQLGFSAYDKQTVDAALECTGAPAALGSLITALKPGGRLVMLGNPKGQVALDGKVYQAILRKELTLLGSWNSSYSDLENDWKEALAALADGSFDIAPLITHRVGMEGLLAQLVSMRDRTAFCCKAMLVHEEG